MVFSLILEKVKHYREISKITCHNFKIGVDPFSRQFISEQRYVYFTRILFKSLNRNLLAKLDYSPDNPYLETFKGYFLIAGDGSDMKLPDFPNVREEFNVKNTPKYTKPCIG